MQVSNTVKAIEEDMERYNTIIDTEGKARKEFEFLIGKVDMTQSEINMSAPLAMQLLHGTKVR